jgi:lipoic acid synthetase
MKELRGVNVDILTLGQYLQPTKNHLPVDRFVHPDEFAHYRKVGLEMGFAVVESGPLVRSSYHAERHV